MYNMPNADIARYHVPLNDAAKPNWKAKFSGRSGNTKNGIWAPDPIIPAGAGEGRLRRRPPARFFGFGGRNSMKIWYTRRPKSGILHVHPPENVLPDRMFHSFSEVLGLA